MTAWTDAVKQQFKIGKAANPAFSLKDAMFAAKKVYKKSATKIEAPLARKTRGKKSGNQRRTARR